MPKPSGASITVTSTTRRGAAGAQDPINGQPQDGQNPLAELSLLCHWDSLPEWRRDNHFIHSGYVRETNSLKRSLHSLTYLHNETVNIYTHLIPSSSVILGLSALPIILGLGLFFEDEITTAETAANNLLHKYIQFYLSTDVTDAISAGIFLLGVATCMGLSAIYHTLTSHSHAVASFGNQLDYLGIVVLIVASMVTLTHYSFIDQSILFRSAFWSITGVLGTICAVVSVKPSFRTPEWRPFRASMFVAFGFSGVVPLLASCYLFGTDSTWSRLSQGWLLTEAVLYISGAILYALRIPECFAPGKYDYFGHSHQIFHVLVVLAAICHGKALYESYKYGHAVLLAEAL